MKLGDEPVAGSSPTFFLSPGRCGTEVPKVMRPADSGRPQFRQSKRVVKLPRRFILMKREAATGRLVLSIPRGLLRKQEARHVFSTPIATLLLGFLISANLLAQSAGTLSGTVVGPSGMPVANAKVSIKGAAAAQATEIQTDAAGRYTAPNLPAGDYQIVVSGEGLAPKTTAVTIGPGSSQTMDLTLTASAGGQNAPTLEDLGLTPSQTQGSTQDQARLDRRSHMLRTHQRLGLITLAPLVATLAVSNGAAGRHSTASGRDLHMALGITTAGLYYTSAAYAIFAPKIPATTVRGPIKLHRTLAWIHGTGMVLTPILGALADQQLNKGERVHGIAKAHGTVAIVTSAAYGLSIAAVSIRF